MSSPKQPNPQAAALASHLRLLADLADRVARDFKEPHEIPSAAPAAAAFTSAVADGEAASKPTVPASEPAQPTNGAPAGTRRGAKRRAVLDFVAKNPNATTEEIIAAVGCARSYISDCLKKKNQ